VRRSVEVSGKSIEEILERAANYFEIPKEKLEYEIISEGKGILSILAPRALKVRVWIKEDNETGSSEERPIDESEEKKNQEPKAIAEEPAHSEPSKVDHLLLDRARNEIETFMTGLFEKMKVNVSAEVVANKDKLLVSIDGEDSGLLIGKKGETLEAFELLSKMYLIRKGLREVPVEVDVANYKKRREEALRKLANRLAKKVIQTGKRIKLEPMLNRERRIIHVALKGHPQVTTYSIGQEPERRVVIDLKERSKAKNSRKKSSRRNKKREQAK